MLRLTALRGSNVRYRICGTLKRIPPTITDRCLGFSLKSTACNWKSGNTSAYIRPNLRKAMHNFFRYAIERADTIAYQEKGHVSHQIVRSRRRVAPDPFRH